MELLAICLLTSWILYAVAELAVKHPKREVKKYAQQLFAGLFGALAFYFISELMNDPFSFFQVCIVILILLFVVMVGYGIHLFYHDDLS